MCHDRRDLAFRDACCHAFYGAGADVKRNGATHSMIGILIGLGLMSGMMAHAAIIAATLHLLGWR
jgi:hypothetical protein